MGGFVEIGSAESARCSAELADRVALAGADLSWMPAVRAVSRHWFIPHRAWVNSRFLDYDTDPKTWVDAVFADATVVTEYDDGVTPREPGAVGWRPTCSSTLPSLVVEMLALASVKEGHRVLEIGTGTGYSTALICERFGEAHVTSVEVDCGAGLRARAALRQAGYTPALVIGDGAAGVADRAPFDRIIATCSLGRIPYAWVEQAAPGAVILGPWGVGLANQGTFRLTVEDGVATGPFIESRAAFMALRSQRRGKRFVRDAIPPEADAEAEVSATKLSPAAIFAAPNAATFVAGLTLPHTSYVYADADDGSGEATLWLWGDQDGSWATVEYEPGATEYKVDQVGPRRLWDLIEDAYAWWTDADRPPQTDFDLTVTRDRQWVRHGTSGRSWTIPA